MADGTSLPFFQIWHFLGEDDGGGGGAGPSGGTVAAVQVAGGLCAGFTSGFITNPLDVLKTRLQVRRSLPECGLWWKRLFVNVESPKTAIRPWRQALEPTTPTTNQRRNLRPIQWLGGLTGGCVGRRRTGGEGHAGREAHVHGHGEGAASGARGEGVRARHHAADAQHGA